MHKVQHSGSPVFAVVGHPNKGKSSVVATLSQNDAIAIALEPGTTRKRQAYPLSADDKILYTLVDTPGFQRPRRVLEWLQAHSLSAADRAETVAAFITQQRGDPRFSDEVELLTPLVEGAGIIYVVDGSVPYSAEHEAEMTILRWTGRPSLALINSIGPDDYSDSWQSALGQFFQVVRQFDAVRAPFAQHLSLLRAFGQLEPEWEQPLEQATHFLTTQREQRKGEAARLIAATLEEMMSYQERRNLPLLSGKESDGEVRQLRKHWYHHQRQQEHRLRHAIERLYQHSRIQRQEAELAWHGEHDLFSEQSRKLWGVSKSYLATAGFGAGAMSGLGIDALTLGHSFGAAALVGGVLGAAGSVLYSGRLKLPILSGSILKNGLKSATFGPVQDSQFGYIVLGRAVDHWWHISHRNHAGRELLVLELEPTDSHWLEELERQSRHSIQATFDRCRKQKALDGRSRERFTSAIEQAMSVYDDWRLNRNGRQSDA